jgi:Bacterial archaeo-eukaryotic release factor family 11
MRVRPDHPRARDRLRVTLHTDMPTRSAVERLLTARDALSVSIYLPTTPVTQDAQAERIELKNLAAEAAQQLARAGADRREVAEVREAIDELVADDDFWAEQARTLAVFASPGHLETFRLPSQLPNVVEVADRFYVKPLLRATTFPQAAFVLALASGSVRLIEITRDGAPFVVDVPGLPKDAASAARRGSIAEREGEKLLLRQFARKVDHALRHVLTGLDVPLILAATEPLASIFRSLNSYPHLVDPGIRESPEHATEEELADTARTVLDEVYASELAAVRDLFDLRFSQGRASTDLATVARAATYAAVDTLLVDIDDKVPGEVDEESGAITLSDEDDAVSYGVIDEIARRVLLSGGRVLALRRPDVPGGGSLAAILRYAF